MTVPPWLTFLIAGMVIFFGLYRLRIAMRSDADNERAMERKGLYGLPRRRHLLFGVLYLVLGGMLIAGALGYPIVPSLFR
jgi:Na+/H+ antiporter NhaD/arsenite permease-like protein